MDEYPTGSKPPRLDRGLIAAEQFLECFHCNSYVEQMNAGSGNTQQYHVRRMPPFFFKDAHAGNGVRFVCRMKATVSTVLYTDCILPSACGVPP